MVERDARFEFVERDYLHGAPSLNVSARVRNGEARFNEPFGVSSRRRVVKRFPKAVGCPVELSLNLLGGKWKVVILARLKEHPLGYAELRERIPDLSDKVLTERLADLQRQGWIERRRDGHGTVQFRYQLTAKGQTLRPVLQQLYEWGAEQAVALNVRIRPNESNEDAVGPT